MKKLLFASALLATISSCSFVKEIQNHCTVSTPSVSVKDGSFVSCLQCDSLAAVVKKAIEKGK